MENISENNENYDINKCELLERNVSSHYTYIFHFLHLE